MTGTVNSIVDDVVFRVPTLDYLPLAGARVVHMLIFCFIASLCLS